MIIKSMSRKHPSFAQLIDYIERESKLKSRQFSIHHNTYSRDREALTEEFMENARSLRFRKNGVYLYHEVLSMTRSHHLEEDKQKATLRTIVGEYLNARGRNHLAYAVLHEDTDNLHFHIVLSANEAGDTNRKRLSKAEFSNIQTSLERWVLQTHPELEQKAVFHQNQTSEERAERQARKDQASHLSNRGEELKRRGGKTTARDDMQERLADIFMSATDPRNFGELLDRAGLKLYQRGTQHGVIDQDGNKYRFARLGLADAWHALDARMSQALRAERVGEQTTAERPAPASRSEQHSTTHHATEPEATTREQEERHRLAEMESLRAARAKAGKRHESGRRDRGQDDGER